MIKQTWIDHGTKVLGIAGIIVSSALAANQLVPSGQPALIPASKVAWFIFANLLIGALTVKRGFTNSENQTPPQ